MILSKHKYFLSRIPLSEESTKKLSKLYILSGLKNTIIAQTCRRLSATKKLFTVDPLIKIQLFRILGLIILLSVILVNCKDQIEKDIVPEAVSVIRKSDVTNLEKKVPIPSGFTLGKIEKDEVSKNQILAYRCEIVELDNFNKLKLTLLQPSMHLKGHDWTQYHFYDDSLQNILDRLKSMNAIQTRSVKIPVQQKIQKPKKQVSISNLQELYSRKLISLDSLKSGIRSNSANKASLQNLQSKANMKNTKVLIKPHIDDRLFMNLLYELNNVLDNWGANNLITSPYSGDVISRTSDEIVIGTLN